MYVKDIHAVKVVVKIILELLNIYIFLIFKNKYKFHKKAK